MNSNEVTKLEFHVLSEADVRRLSVCQITTTTLYEKNFPKNGGMNNVQLGTMDRRYYCGTCVNDIRTCSGHFGHIELPFAICHPAYISEVLKILRCVCHVCGHLLCDDEDETARIANTLEQTQKKVKAKRYVRRVMKLPANERLAELAKICAKRKSCGNPQCDFAVPHYAKVDNLITCSWSDEALAKAEANALSVMREPFTYDTVHSILNYISPKTYTILGYDITNNPRKHPINCILKCLLVSPPCIRPSIAFSDNGKCRGQNELTYKLQEILKACLSYENAQLKGPLSAEARLNHVVKVQDRVAEYICQDSSKSNTHSGRKTNASVTARFKGKTGRFRYNLMGKRVDNAGRCVANGDCNIQLDEVGVPDHIALILTKKERVNERNIRELATRVRVGPGNLKGASQIIQSDGTEIDLRFCKNPPRLQLGWQVERPLQNGDIALLNRYPSLHKKSIMAHRIRIFPNTYTFRINELVCFPYNADFDGD